MPRKQEMYWGKNKWDADDDIPFWKRLLGIASWYGYPWPTEGIMMRLTLDGDDLEAYYNDKGVLCVIDPDTNEEVMAIWG